MVNASQSPILIDLYSFVQSLPPEFDTLAGKARQWFSRHSCDADLGISELYLQDAIRFHNAGRESLNQAKGALLQSAVLHYARAFDPASKHRRHISILSKLNPTDQEIHRTLMNLRNESLAHFGPAGESDTPWSEDIPAMIVDGNVWQVMVASRRALYRPSLAPTFLNHLKAVRPLVTSLSEKSKKSFETELEELWRANSLINDLLLQNEMNSSRLGGWSGPFLGGKRSGRSITTLGELGFTN